MSLDYIKQHYAVPADIGRVIHFQGRQGVIVGANNATLKVNFDDAKPNKYEYLHPTWNVEYGEMCKIRPLTASQKRYQEWRNSETDLTFAQWCGMDKKSKTERTYRASLKAWDLTV